MQIISILQNFLFCADKGVDMQIMIALKKFIFVLTGEKSL